MVHGDGPEQVIDGMELIISELVVRFGIYSLALFSLYLSLPITTIPIGIDIHIH